MDIFFKVKGDKELERALNNLGRKAPTAARRAVNRAIGVARQRVIRHVAAHTGLSRAVIGGRTSRRARSTGLKTKGRGYIKQVKASRRRSTGALVALVEGILFHQTHRKTATGLRIGPGGKPFRGRSRWSRSETLLRRQGRARFPIQEVVIPIQPYAERAIRVHMRRAARTVYPAKLWEELKKHIKPAPPSAPM